MMTACSPVELARSNTRDGHGLFTGHLIEGFKESKVDFPEKKRSLVTVRKL